MTYPIFREWCKKNAAVIDFVSKIVIALCAALVAVYAASIAKSQLAVQQSQLQVQELQARAQMSHHLPNLRLRFEVSPSLPLMYDLVIENEGGDLFDLDVRLLQFWHPREIKIIHAGSHQQPDAGPLKRALLPVRGTFAPLVEATVMSRGQLLMYRGESHATWERHTMQFENLFKTESRGITSDILTFARTDYVDRFGESHTQYFAVGLTGMRPIAVERGSKLERRHGAVALENQLDFLSPDLRVMKRMWIEHSCAAGCDDGIEDAWLP